MAVLSKHGDFNPDRSKYDTPASKANERELAEISPGLEDALRKALSAELGAEGRRLAKLVDAELVAYRGPWAGLRLGLGSGPSGIEIFEVFLRAGGTRSPDLYVCRRHFLRGPRAGAVERFDRQLLILGTRLSGKLIGTSRSMERRRSSGASDLCGAPGRRSARSSRRGSIATGTSTHSPTRKPAAGRIDRVVSKRLPEARFVSANVWRAKSGRVPGVCAHQCVVLPVNSSQNPAGCRDS